MAQLSIVTINYNDCIGLRRTIDSLRSLKNNFNDKLEFIIVDGGSSDGSLQVINKNAEIIDKFVSEKDNGIYDAMNKGVLMSQGDYICFMNAGDCFYSGFDINAFLKNTKNEKVYCFNNIIKVGNIHFTRYLKEGDMPCHQAMLIPKSCFDHKCFDTRYKIAADYDFNKWLLNSYSSIYINSFMCINELGGISNNWQRLSNLQLHMRELVEIEQLDLFGSLTLKLKNLSKFLLIELFGYKMFYIYQMWRNDESN